MQLQLGDELESRAARLAVFGFFFLTAALMTASLLRNDAQAFCTVSAMADMLPHGFRPTLADAGACLGL